MTVEEIIAGIQNYGDQGIPFMANEAPRLKVTEFRALEKGCLVFAEGERYPARMHMRGDKCNTVAQFKRLIPEVLSGFKGNIFKKSITAVYFLISWRDYVRWMRFFLSGVYFENPDRYNQPIREMYRVISNEGIRDIICSILEYDNAYRYRFQDVVELMDKDNEPIKEIERLLEILISREQTEGIKHKWRKVRSAVWVVRLYPPLYREVKRIMKEMDINEIKSSIEDRYWQYINPDYDYNGWDFASRMKWYYEQKGQLNNQ